jgi:hypothetical protein
MSFALTDELVEAIAELRGLFPDWRMGQLVANLVMAAGSADGSAIWDIEDDRLLAAARRLIDRNRGRQANIAEPATRPDRAGFASSTGATPS